MIATPSPKDVARNPELFARHLLKIQNKAMRTVPLVYNPLQQRYLKERTARDLILKPRQIGFTTCIQAEFRRYEWTRPASTMTLGKDDENTKELRRIADFFYDNLPEGFAPKRHYGNATLATYPGMNSRAVIATAGSKETGRGGTRTHIHGSEIAFWPDAKKILLGAMQAGSPQWITLESTPNGMGGEGEWFYDHCMEALDYPDKSIWTLHFYTWFDHPEYRIPLAPGETLDYTDDERVLIERHSLVPEQIKWRRAKIAELDGNLDDFQQEYAEDPHTCFKKSGSAYFGMIDHAFTAPTHPEYDASHAYVAGLDFGQQQDYTALSIGDSRTFQQVDLLHVRRERWEDMRSQVREKCKRWNVRLLIVEENSIGSPNIEALRNEFQADGLEAGILPFTTTAVSKPPLMASLRMAIQEGGFKMQPIPVQKREFNSTVSKQTAHGWSIDTPRDKKGDGVEQGHGDTVIANALLWHAISMHAGSGAFIW